MKKIKMVEDHFASNVKGFTGSAKADLRDLDIVVAEAENIRPETSTRTVVIWTALGSGLAIMVIVLAVYSKFFAKNPRDNIPENFELMTRSGPNLYLNVSFPQNNPLSFIQNSSPPPPHHPPPPPATNNTLSYPQRRISNFDDQ